MSMSAETREAIREVKDEVTKKFDELKEEHIKPLNQRIKNAEDKHEKDMKIIQAEVDGKVSFKVFTWVLGILMFVVVGIQSVVWFQVKETYNKTNEVDKSVSLISQRLDQFEAVK